MSDGTVDGENLLCGLHGWDCGFRTGISSYDNNERLEKFSSWVEGDGLFVDGDEIAAWESNHPQSYDRDAYQGTFQDPHGTRDEPHVGLIGKLSNEGLSYVGHHGPVTSMGVSREELPKWDDLQFMTAQLARKPLLDEVDVFSGVVIGPNVARPLVLDIAVFVSDMSCGALSEEAKVALSRGAELTGTGICSGEGGMLPEEQAENSHYFFELASGKFGWDISNVDDVQAFHFKLGQGAKTGTGGHLPGSKV
jgi:glutamate synthase domain-containing protein 2